MSLRYERQWGGGLQGESDAGEREREGSRRTQGFWLGNARESKCALQQEALRDFPKESQVGCPGCSWTKASRVCLG